VSEEMKVGLDPKAVLAAMEKMAKGAAETADKIEDALGKDAPKSIKKFEEAAENGTNRVTSFFRNLGQRVREDLKTAFDATGVLAGAKFAKDLGEGVKQVFEMERAFSRLNARLGLSNSEMLNFKKNLGSKVAATGQKLEDVLPGVETASAKGGVKDSKQLANIGESLAKVKAATGEDVEGLSESVVEILKKQNIKVTDKSFKDTVDAVQGTRTAGAFKTSGDAANAIQDLSPYGKQMGLGTREMGGLAAMASKSGDSGQGILKQLMEQGSTAGGKTKLNALFGQNVFGKNGKLDASAIGKIDTGRFGEYSQQTMSESTGIQGANGADLKRFVESFHEGLGEYNKVISGSNETAAQFDIATDNMASKIDRFKEQSKEAAREIGESVSQMGKDLLNGHFSSLGKDAKNVGSSLWENKGTVGAGLGITAGVGMLAGGGINRLLKKIPGGGLLGGAVAGEAAKAAGITPVYVTNISEMGGGAGALSKFGGAAGKLGAIGGVVGAAAIGYEIGSAIMQTEYGEKLSSSLAGTAYDAIHNDKKDMARAEDKQNSKLTDRYNQSHGTHLTPAEFSKAVEEGTLRAHSQNKQNVNLSNPSTVTGRGKSM
jgi:hypothetical protein